MSNASGCDGFAGPTDFADRAAGARGASGGEWMAGARLKTTEKEPQISQIRADDLREGVLSTMAVGPPRS